MKLWTMLAGLAVAGILASSVYAQDQAPPKKGKGRFQAPATYKQLVDSKVIKDGDKVTQKAIIAYNVSKIPADLADDAKTTATDRATRMAKGLWTRVVAAAKVDGQTDPETAALDGQKYDDTVKSLPRRGGKKGGQKQDAPAAPATT